jgi:SAM-dependent methyltransferase
MFELGRIHHWWDISRRYPVLRDEHSRGTLKALGYAHVVSFLAEHAPQRVLEFGHGFGSPLPELFGATSEMWALDDYVDVPYWTREEFEAKRRIVEQQHPQVRFVQGLLGAGGNALADASFDLVCSVSVLEELEPPVIDAVVRDAARLLRPGGLFVNSMDCTTRYIERIEYFFRCQLRHGLRWVKPVKGPRLKWDIHDVAFEDPCFVMKHYMGYQPDEGRLWTGNFATVLSASRKA